MSDAIFFFFFFNGSDNLRVVAVFFKICTKVTDLKNNTPQSNCGHNVQSIDFLICSDGLLPLIDYANS